jgi:hypothetical protein
MLLSGMPTLPASCLPPAPRMNSDGSRQTLLDELEAQQNELLDELDRLNTRIEQVLRDAQRIAPSTADRDP